MDIIGALKQEEVKLQRHLTAVQGAIAALNGRVETAVSRGYSRVPRGTRAKRSLSAAVRAKMSRAAKLRWAKIKAKRNKGKKAK